jgi:molybdopterin-guanine dinucleotide biosynthesis protein A
MSADAQHITGLILAGGRGSRMEGVDKGLQNFGDSTLVAQVLARLQPQVSSVMINANRNLEQYRRFGVPVWQDDMEHFGEYAGPLAGLHAGLSHCNTPYLACVPCDTPSLPTDLVARLAQALQAHQADLAVAAANNGNQRNVHRVCALMKTEVLGRLERFLLDGNSKVGAWQAKLKTIEVDFDDDAAFSNINTLQELRNTPPR